jgi:hypothetical protein
MNLLHDEIFRICLFSYPILERTEATHEKKKKKKKEFRIFELVFQLISISIYVTVIFAGFSPFFGKFPSFP